MRCRFLLRAALGAPEFTVHARHGAIDALAQQVSRLRQRGGVVVRSCRRQARCAGKLHAWWLDKTEKHSWCCTILGSGFRFGAEPAVADLDGNGQAKVIFTTWPQKGGIAVGTLIVLSFQGVPLASIDLAAAATGAAASPRPPWRSSMATPTWRL